MERDIELRDTGAKKEWRQREAKREEGETVV